MLPPRCCKTLRQGLPNIVARGESKRFVNKITSFQGYFSIVDLKTLGQKAQTYLRPEEYARLLSAAGSNPRDLAILQLFLQTGIRVSELVNLTLADVDLANKILKVDGKGSKERTIPLEKKAVMALKNY